jgi:hypothetical protein
MKLSKQEAALLSDRERELLQARGPWQVKPLVRTIERVRALRDKASDLLQRQTIAVRQGKGAQRPGAANERSAAKLAVLERALAHFREALEQIDDESTQAVAALRRDDDAAGSDRTSRGSPDADTTRRRATKRATATVQPPARSRAVAKKPAERKVVDRRSPDERISAVAKRATVPANDRSRKARQPIARAVAGPGGPQQTSSASRKSRRG